YEAAMERFSRPTAVAFASEMIRLHALGGASQERADTTRVDLLLCRGEAWRHFGSRELAQQDVREARDVLAELEPDEEVIALGVRADVLEAQVLHYRDDTLAEALDVLDEGLARVTAIDSPAARLATTRLVRERLSHLGWSTRVRE